jgi:hypothetical protein
MRTLLLAILLCAPAIAQDKSEPPALIAARKDYETGVNLAKRAHEATLEKLAKVYREKLAELVEDRTKKGDLDGALSAGRFIFPPAQLQYRSGYQTYRAG